MTTARQYPATADELAAAIVHNRLEMFDGITVRYDRRLLGAYGVDPEERTIVLPNGLPWREEHSRINRCWLYLYGGTRLADEFAPLERDHPDRRIVSGGTVTPIPGSVPILRRVW